MSEIHEAIEKAQEGEHGEGFNKRVALVIAILALFLSFSETAGKGAQTEAISKNVESSDLWAFFQAKNIRITQATTAAEAMTVAATGATDPAVKAAMEKQIEAWKATAERLKSEPKTGRDELAEQAADADQPHHRPLPQRADGIAAADPGQRSNQRADRKGHRRKLKGGNLSGRNRQHRKQRPHQDRSQSDQGRGVVSHVVIPGREGYRAKPESRVSQVRNCAP